MTSTTLINGRPADQVSIHDRGLNYGDGLFDTLLVRNGRPQLYSLHMQRLQQSCERLGLQWDQSQLLAEHKRLFSQAAVLPRACLKTVISRGEGARGYAIPATVQPTRILSLSELPSIAATSPLNTMLCQARLSRNSALAGMKHLCRLENVMARTECADRKLDEGILLDEAGLVIEGTISNIFWLNADVLYTPRLHRCGVEGVVRRLIIEQLASAMDLPVREGDYALDTLYQAEEIMLCNSLMGVRPVASIGCFKLGNSGLAEKLQQALEAIDV